MSEIIFPSVYPVTGHTDFVGQDSTFVAIAGAKQNGVDFIPAALAKGATKIVVAVDAVVSPEIQNLIIQHHATLEFVDDTRKMLAQLCAQALDFPAKKLKIIGITGTKGKTSSSYIAYHMLHAIGKKVALISTIEKRIGSQLISIPLTTPLPDQLQMFLRVCVDQGVEYVVLEVSAQALTLGRVDGIEFEAGVFTNFSHEHLEFYKTLSDYFAAKKLFLSRIKDSKNMFINKDDHNLAQLLAQNPQYSSFSLQDKTATFYGCTHQVKNETILHLAVEGKMYDIGIPFLGMFNVYNVLGVLCLMKALQIDFSDLKYALKDLAYVPGRMEKYALKNGALCFIDYAHNPSSFEAVLSTLRSLTDHLIVVFGAGGNRDAQKRPLMGAIAQKYCDIVILTSDNPRDENPADIAAAIEKGFDKTKPFEFYKELNRVKAIELGHELSRKGTIIAILGKGRDEYQIVGGLTFPFKERSIIKPFMIEHETNN
jgi:UDP-N-acetylmuramyl-tripeptide synthetase